MIGVSIGGTNRAGGEILSSVPITTTSTWTGASIVVLAASNVVTSLMVVGSITRTMNDCPSAAPQSSNAVAVDDGAMMLSPPRRS